MSPRRKFDRSLLPDRPDLTFEKKLWEGGIALIAGVDEAGRGALAGPVSAGVVILPSNHTDIAEQLIGVRDSKVMTPKAREAWALVIKEVAVAWGVGFSSADKIDRVGIVPATYRAVNHAIDQIECVIEHFLVDYIRIPDVDAPQTPLVKGDARSLSIASAAILAKVTRDELMMRMDVEYPGYGFASNKGYATEMHRKAIKQLGPCRFHRKTFSPVADYYSLFPSE